MPTVKILEYFYQISKGFLPQEFNLKNSEFSQITIFFHQIFRLPNNGCELIFFPTKVRAFFSVSLSMPGSGDYTAYRTYGQKFLTPFSSNILPGILGVCPTYFPPKNWALNNVPSHRMEKIFRKFHEVCDPSRLSPHKLKPPYRFYSTFIFPECFHPCLFPPV